MGLLTVAGVVAGYSAADQILKGVDFTVDEGEIVCIIGPNGAGKSTLLKAIAGLLTPSAGSILLRDRPIAGALGAYRDLFFNDQATRPWLCECVARQLIGSQAKRAVYLANWAVAEILP